MRYLQSFLTLMGFSLAGEVLQRLIPVPIPASVYGIILLFAALCAGLVKVEQVKSVGTFLTGILPIFFVPSVVGILENWELIRHGVGSLVVLVMVSTVLTFLVSGKLAQKAGKQEETSHE